MFKEDSAGFAEVFLNCPLEIAEKRNSLRSHPVAPNTMRNMFSKMEPPEPEKFPWEQYSLVIKAEEEPDIEIMYVCLLMGCMGLSVHCIIMHIQSDFHSAQCGL